MAEVEKFNPMTHRLRGMDPVVDALSGLFEQENIQPLIHIRGAFPNCRIAWPSDWIEIDGVMVVGPSGDVLPLYLIFCALHIVDTDDQGHAEIRIQPPIITSGRYRNASNSPEDGARVRLPAFWQRQKKGECG